MPKRGKKYQESIKLVDRHNLYDPKEAIELVLQTSKANFDETVEVAIRLGVDPKHADQQVRGAIVLPHGTGRTRTVLVIAKGEKLEEAKAAGADYVGGEEMVAKIQNEGWLDFDVVVATPDMMGVVGRIGRVLGPKGLMPNPKTGTVTMDVKKAVSDAKSGQVTYRTDRDGNVHVPVGKVSFTEEALKGNFDAIYEKISRLRPAAVKGTYIKHVSLASTFGPSVTVDTNSL